MTTAGASGSCAESDSGEHSTDDELRDERSLV